MTPEEFASRKLSKIHKEWAYGYFAAGVGFGVGLGITIAILVITFLLPLENCI